MSTPMHMDDALLTLAQWLSPAYPLGSFAFSHGLEAAVADGAVTDADLLEAWLRDLLEQGSARSDAVWLSRAWAGAGALDAIDALARSYCASSARLREADQQGRAFVRVTNAVWALDLPDLLLPVAVGAAASRKGIAHDAVCALFLQSFVANLVSAAQRLMPLGQTGAQAIVARLSPVCLAVARAERETQNSAAVWSNTLMSDIAAMRQETMDVRVFQS